MKKILVTGGAGYVGAVLVPKLMDNGYRIKVVDLFLYDKNIFREIKDHPQLEIVKGDIRDTSLIAKHLCGIDAVIHLACISNDPSFNLNPELGKSINYDAFLSLVKMSKDNGVKRFIYASSSSVYGIKEETNVTEDLELKPLTDYSKYKALCEEVLLAEQDSRFTTLVIRPATVCGYSPRLRLDLTVNIFVNQAVTNREITIFGGSQKRPNINIEDMTDLYVKAMEYDDALIGGKIYNVGYQNHSIMALAEIVREIIGKNEVKISVTSTDDLRSYHISSEKIKNELGFRPRHTIEEAVINLLKAFKAGKIKNPLNNISYYNIKMLKAINFN